MDYKQLKYFLHLYNYRNISHASKSLFLSQQGLSKAVKKMEDDLGFPLFLRTHSGVEPTRYGEIIYKHIDVLLDEYDKMFNELRYGQGHEGGKLFITMPLGSISLLSPKIFLLFAESYPKIDFVFKEHSCTTSKSLIMEEKADLAFSISPVDTEEFNFIPFYSLKGAVLVNKKHPIAAKSEVFMEDLRGERLIFCGCAAYFTVVEACRKLGFEPHVILSTTDLSTPFLYIQSNLGICPYLYNRKTSISLPDDTVLVPFCHDYNWDVCIITKKGRPLSENTKLFINFVHRFQPIF